MWTKSVLVVTLSVVLCLGFGLANQHTPQNPGRISTTLYFYQIHFWPTDTYGLCASFPSHFLYSCNAKSGVSDQCMRNGVVLVLNLYIEMRVFLSAHNRKEAAQNSGKPQLLRLSRLMYLCAFLSAATLWSHFHLTFGPATAGNSHHAEQKKIPAGGAFLSQIPSIFFIQNPAPFLQPSEQVDGKHLLSSSPSLIAGTKRDGIKDLWPKTDSSYIKSIEHPSPCIVVVRESKYGALTVITAQSRPHLGESGRAPTFLFIASASRTLFLLTLRCVIRVRVLGGAGASTCQPAGSREQKKKQTDREVKKGNSAVILGNASFLFFCGRVFVFLSIFPLVSHAICRG